MSSTDAAEKLFSGRQATRLYPRIRRLVADLRGGDALSIARRMALTAFAIRVASAAIAFISQILLARIMGDVEYGIFVFVWVLAVILGNLSCLGFHTAVIRFLPQYRDASENDAVRGLTSAARVFALLSATVIAATGIATVWLLGDRLAGYYVVPLIIGAFALPMIALGDVLDGTARANGWPFNALAPTYLARPVLILVFVLALAYLAGPVDAQLALVAALAAAWLTTLAQFLVIDGRISRHFERGSLRFHLRAWTLTALPIFLIEGFYFLLTNADVIIVGFYLPPEKVAVYYAAAKTMALVHFVYFAVKAAAAPRFSALVAAGAHDELAAFARQTVRWTFWPSLAVGALVVAAGPLLLSLFGPGFATGHVVMTILFAGILAKAAIGPGEVLLTMAGHLKICTAVYAGALGLDLVLNMVLIPSHGIAGAAVATAAAMTCEALLLHLVVRRRLGIALFIAVEPFGRKRPGGTEKE